MPPHAIRTLLITAAILVGCASPNPGLSPTTLAPPVATAAEHTPHLITVRYRADPVDIAHPAFEYLDTSGSSLVRGAWYDDATGYMVISLNGTYYHYCSMPGSAWIAFEAAASFGSHYNAAIKGRYGCQGTLVPEY